MVCVKENEFYQYVSTFPHAMDTDLRSSYGIGFIGCFDIVSVPCGVTFNNLGDTVNVTFFV